MSAGFVELWLSGSAGRWFNSVGGQFAAACLRKLSTGADAAAAAACIIMWPTIVYHMQRLTAYRAVQLVLLACRLHFAVFSLCATDHVQFECAFRKEIPHIANLAIQMFRGSVCQLLFCFSLLNSVFGIRFDYACAALSCRFFNN